MAQDFDDLLKHMPAVADAVNAFSSEEAQLRALDALLNTFHGKQVLEVDEGVSRGAADEQPEEPATADPAPVGGTEPAWAKGLFSGLPDAHAIATSGTQQQQVMWALITLLHRAEVGEVKNVSALLKQELGVTPPGRPRVSTLLKELVPKYAQRAQAGRAYAYTPTVRALEVFKNVGENG
jgi:hypothetical protein